MGNTPIFIIPSAGKGVRAFSEKPTLLTKFADGECLYEKQVQAIRKYFPNSIIIYITGFNCDKIDDKLKNIGCRIRHNLEYENTTNLASVYHTLLDLPIESPICIINGNIFLNTYLTNKLNKEIQKNTGSFVFINKEFDKYGVGLGPNYLFDYCFEDKWTKISYLSIKDIQKFLEISSQVNFKTRFVFEIYNIARIQLQKVFVDECKEIFKIKHVKELNAVLGRKK